MKDFRALFLVAVLASTVLLTPAIALAQFGAGNVVDYLWVRTFGFQASWLNEPNMIILNVIIPTIAIYAIFLGLARAIGIFQAMGEHVEHMIALLVAFAALFSGGIGYVSGLLAFMGHFSIIIFAILFIIGAIFYAKGMIGRNVAAARIWSSYKKSSREVDVKIRGLDQSEQKMLMDLAKISDRIAKGSKSPTAASDIKKWEAEARRIADQIAALKEKRTKYEAERNEMRKVLATAESVET